MATCAGAALMLGFAAPASAATFKGPTTQGKTIKLTVNKAGEPAKARYEWDMECSGDGTLTNGSTLSSRFADADVDGFRSTGSYTADLQRRFEAEVQVRIGGDRASDTRFTGTFKLKAKVFKRGSDEVLARCGTGIVRWTADLKGPAPVPEPPVAPRFHQG